MTKIDYAFKLVIIGDTNVGKSCMLKRFTYDDFSKETHPTIGIDLGTGIVKINDKKIKLIIWDTAGQERFRTIVKCYFRNVVGIFLCYDTTNNTSFNNLNYWINYIKINNSENIPVMLIGTKIDLINDRVVPKKYAKIFANKNNMEYFEVSSYDNSNRSVARCFMSLTGLILKNISNGDISLNNYSKKKL